MKGRRYEVQDGEGGWWGAREGGNGRSVGT